MKMVHGGTVSPVLCTISPSYKASLLDQQVGEDGATHSSLIPNGPPMAGVLCHRMLAGAAGDLGRRLRVSPLSLKFPSRPGQLRRATMQQERLFRCHGTRRPEKITTHTSTLCPAGEPWPGGWGCPTRGVAGMSMSPRGAFRARVLIRPGPLLRRGSAAPDSSPGPHRRPVPGPCRPLPRRPAWLTSHLTLDCLPTQRRWRLWAGRTSGGYVEVMHFRL